MEQSVSLEVAKLAKELDFEYNLKSPFYYVLGYGGFKEDGIVKKFHTDNPNMYQFCKLSKGQPHIALAPSHSVIKKWLRNTFKVAVDTVCVNSSTMDDFNFSVFSENEVVSIVSGFDSEEKAFGAGFVIAMEFIKSKL